MNHKKNTNKYFLIAEAKKFDDNTVCIICPQCQGMILCDKKKINCKQFRHGIKKTHNKQLNPHRGEIITDPETIYGCGAYFKIK